MHRHELYSKSKVQTGHSAVAGYEERCAIPAVRYVHRELIVCGTLLPLATSWPMTVRQPELSSHRLQLGWKRTVVAPARRLSDEPRSRP